MRFETLIFNIIQHFTISYAVCLVSGLFCGIILAGAVFATTSHFYSLRIFRWQILDEIRRELRNPLASYVEWLNMVTAEFSVWKNDFLPRFTPENAHDLYQLNRLRGLYVDPRGQIWSQRVEEYAPMMRRFHKDVEKLRTRQVRIHDEFSSIFHLLDQHPPMTVEPSHRLENLAFEQSQSVSEFMHRLQYEFLTAVADSKPKAVKKFRVHAKPVVRRSSSRTPARLQPAARDFARL